MYKKKAENGRKERLEASGQHLDSEKKKRFKCETCSKTFSTISNRNFHKKKCSGQAISFDQELMEDSSKDQANLPNVNESSLDPSVTTQPDHRPNTDTAESLELNSEPKKYCINARHAAKHFQRSQAETFI